ncbi:hypothetical protein [Natrinema versiforme]|uniref:DUF1102 domain-containing protein n=1 Tax=Natrinema versiforme TaxID=88724 RepID=A0A4V1FXY2_9EURY|nr:hypothetical protein [Natrinema versiforme]QCS41133.1 hypothetical protein FEJ81_01760 [Natrinema versiforme]
MRMNRRNVLVGLGTIVAGGGAALGTGAFSSVEANRTVSVTTSGDANALVAFNITSSLLEGSEGSDDEMIQFDLEDLNIGAITRFDGGFEITNNRETQSDTITLSIDDGDGNSITTTDASVEDDGMYFEYSDGDLTDIDGDGGSVTLDVVFNLENSTDTSTADGNLPSTVAITADDSSGGSA